MGLRAKPKAGETKAAPMAGPAVAAGELAAKAIREMARLKMEMHPICQKLFRPLEPKEL